MHEIIQDAGGPRIIADHFGIRPQAVSQWVKIPAERVLGVAKLTGWKWTPHRLCPEMYPHPDDGLPEHLRGKAAA